MQDNTHEVDTSLAMEDIAIVPQYFLMMSSDIEAEDDAALDDTTVEGIEEDALDEVSDEAEPVYEVTAAYTVHVVDADELAALVEDEESGVTAVSDTMAIVAAGRAEESVAVEDTAEADDLVIEEETTTTESDDGADTATDTESTVTEAPSATAAPVATTQPVTATATPSATEKPTATAAPAATATPTATAKPAATTTPTATTAPTATTKPTSTATPTATPHAHDWVTETTTTPEQGHYETVQTGTKTVIDQEAWTEYRGSYYQCLTCGYTTTDGADISWHVVDICGGGGRL